MLTNKERCIITCLLITAGCANESSSTRETVSTQSSEFSWDESDISNTQFPSTIPTQRFEAAKQLTRNNLETSIVGESIVETKTLENGDVIGESKHFSAEWNPFRGRFLTRVTEGANLSQFHAVSTDNIELETDSRLLIQNLGIPDQEIGKVFQQTRIKETADHNAQRTRSVDAYVTLFDRAVGGIRVSDHRAVVVHDTSGRIIKASAFWPTLAESGHVLQPTATTQTIKQRAATKLAQLGVPPQKAKLHYVFSTQSNSDGTVCLTLQVDAAILPTYGATDKVQHVLVDVN